MKRGPDAVVACPHCGAFARHRTLISGNTFGARLWTDGKMIAPMLPEPPPFVQCHHCRAFYWLADAPCIGHISVAPSETEGVPDEWLKAPEVAEPSEEGYYEALAGAFVESPEEEKFLRLLALWKHNDPIRDVTGQDRPQPVPLSERARENMEKLTELLDESRPDEGVLKAEVFRELGQFEKARQTLLRIGARDYESIIHFLLNLCDAGDDLVQEIA